MLTMNRAGLKRVGAASLCAVLLTGAVMVANHQLTAGQAAETAADTGPASIATTQDIVEWFRARGLEVDLTTAAVDEVKVPKKWDGDFTAFEAVVQQSGKGLARYKGKAVEKWTMTCPARSDGQNTCQAVLLVYKKKPVGAYLLTQPSGEVTGLSDAAPTAAAPEPVNVGVFEVETDPAAAVMTAAEEEWLMAAGADPVE